MQTAARGNVADTANVCQLMNHSHIGRDLKKNKYVNLILNKTHHHITASSPKLAIVIFMGNPQQISSRFPKPWENEYFFSHLKKQNKYGITILSIKKYIARLFIFTIRRDARSNANNVANNIAIILQIIFQCK